MELAKFLKSISLLTFRMLSHISIALDAQEELVEQGFVYAFINQEKEVN
jgi:hypothetical protein